MFNPVIIIAIIVQSAVSKGSRIAGAILGYMITTGIFIWGLSAYAEGNYIMIFGIELSQSVFIGVCLVWYGFDTKEFLSAKKLMDLSKAAAESPLLQDSRIMNFYQNTLTSWGEGKLSALSPAFEKESKMQYEDFVKTYLPIEGGSLHQFFNEFPPNDGEYLIGFGDEEGKHKGWFVLTDQRLVQRDGEDNLFKEVKWEDVASFKVKGTWTKQLKFQLKSGNEVEFKKVNVYPAETFLKTLIKKD